MPTGGRNRPQAGEGSQLRPGLAAKRPAKAGSGAGRGAGRPAAGITQVFLKNFCNGKTVKITCIYRLIEATIRQIVFVQAKKMSQLVQKSRVNFLAKGFFIAFRKTPDVFEEQNNLRRQHRGAVVSEL